MSHENWQIHTQGSLGYLRKAYFFINMLKAKFCLFVTINDLCMIPMTFFYPHSCFKMIIYLFIIYLLLFKGVICRWSSNSILEVDLNYCKDPVNYHVYLKDPSLKNRNISIGEKDEQDLFKTDTMTAKIKVTKLNRSGNTVITSVRAMLVVVLCN